MSTYSVVSSLIVRSSVQNLNDLTLDRWYDKSTRNWIITLKDKAGNQVGDAIFVATSTDAKGIKKTNPAFNVRDFDAENEERYKLKQFKK